MNQEKKICEQIQKTSQHPQEHPQAEASRRPSKRDRLRSPVRNRLWSRRNRASGVRHDVRSASHGGARRLHRALGPRDISDGRWSARNEVNTSVPSPTTGMDPRPFAVSGVIINTLVITVITPAKRQINAKYRNTVTIHAPTGFSIGFGSAFFEPSRESVLYFLPVKIGRIKHIKNWIRSAQDARYMPSCAQPCGAPLFFEICSARIRVAMNRTHSIGAN